MTLQTSIFMLSEQVISWVAQKLMRIRFTVYVHILHGFNYITDLKALTGNVCILHVVHFSYSTDLGTIPQSRCVIEGVTFPIFPLAKSEIVMINVIYIIVTIYKINCLKKSYEFVCTCGVDALLTALYVRLPIMEPTFSFTNQLFIWSVQLYFR